MEWYMTDGRVVTDDGHDGTEDGQCGGFCHVERGVGWV